MKKMILVAAAFFIAPLSAMEQLSDTAQLKAIPSKLDDAAQRKLDTELFIAVGKNDVIQAQHLLINGANPNAFAHESFILCPVIFIARTQPMIRTLLDYGCKMTIIDPLHANVFHTAIDSNSLYRIALLLLNAQAHGIDLKLLLFQKDIYGQTPLAYNQENLSVGSRISREKISRILTNPSLAGIICPEAHKDFLRDMLGEPAPRYVRNREMGHQDQDGSEKKYKTTF